MPKIPNLTFFIPWALFINIAQNAQINFLWSLRELAMRWYNLGTRYVSRKCFTGGQQYAGVSQINISRRAQIMNKIKFEELCKLEPELRKLHRLASMMGRKRGKVFCANAIWYDIFRPRLKNIVGWSRVAKLKVVIEPQRASFLMLNRADILALPDPPKCSDKIEVMNPASECMDSILWSSEAYDVAYDAIFNALPDCRRCSCYHFNS